MATEVGISALREGMLVSWEHRICKATKCHQWFWSCRKQQILDRIPSRANHTCNVPGSEATSALWRRIPGRGLAPLRGSWHPTPSTALCRDALDAGEFTLQLQLCPEKIFILHLQGLTEHGGHGDCSWSLTHARKPCSLEASKLPLFHVP